MFARLKTHFHAHGVVRTRIAKFRPQEKPKDPRAIDVEYTAAELVAHEAQQTPTGRTPVAPETQRLTAPFGAVSRPNAVLSYEDFANLDFADLEARAAMWLEDGPLV